MGTYYKKWIIIYQKITKVPLKSSGRLKKLPNGSVERSTYANTGLFTYTICIRIQ